MRGGGGAGYRYSLLHSPIYVQVLTCSQFPHPKASPNNPALISCIQESMLINSFRHSWHLVAAVTIDLAYWPGRV